MSNEPLDPSDIDVPDGRDRLGRAHQMRVDISIAISLAPAWLRRALGDKDVAKARSARMEFGLKGLLAASTFGDKVTRAAWRSMPTWFVVSADDRVIALQMERDLAAQMKAETTVLNASHVALLSHPREVAAVIEDTVRSGDKAR